MTYFEVRNKNGEIIISNMQKCKYWESFGHDKNRSIKMDGKNIRSGQCDFDDGSVWLIEEDNKDLIKSTKLFKRTMRIYGEMAGSFLDYYLHKIRAHSHTLRSIQGKMKQKVDSLAKKEDFRGQNYLESKNKIAEKVRGDVDKSAEVLCYLNKRISEIDAHIEGFDVLYMGDEMDVKIELHDLKRTLQNIIAPFHEDLSTKGIQVNFHIKDGYSKENKVGLDYKLMNLAFVNFFDNAIKYSKPNSDLDISFIKTGKGFVLDISMMSLRIEHDELERIFEEGYSGKYASEEAGDGIGMYVIRKSLGMMNTSIRIEPDYGMSTIFNEKQYVKNKFIFESEY